MLASGQKKVGFWPEGKAAKDDQYQRINDASQIKQQETLSLLKVRLRVEILCL